MSPWKIWYSDGSTVSSDDCAPADVPGRGVEVIAQPDSREGPGVWNVRWVTLCANWYYWRTDVGEWMAAECLDDVMDLLLDREPIDANSVCKGRKLPHARFRAIYDEAKAWAEAQGLGAKTHFVREERKP